jgi:hypothetical protein
MTQIICRASGCLFWEEGICGSEEIEYEPDVGCLMFQDIGDLVMEDAVDEDDELDDLDDDLFDDDEDTWDDSGDDWDDEDWDDL